MADIELVEPKIAKASEVNAKAEEIKTKRELPPKPGNTVKFHELLEWLKLLPEGAEERITIWVYRRNPVINRQLVNPDADNNIDTIYSGFGKLSEDYIKENHGGGNYKFVVKDEDKPKTQKGGFFEATLNIEMVDCPPKLDLREVDWDHPHNKGFKSWCKAKRMIDGNNMPVIEKTGDTQAVVGGFNENMLKTVLDFTSKMSDKEQNALKKQIGGEDAMTKSMNEILLEKIKQEDPNKQMNTLVAMMTAMRGMQPEIKPDNTMATMLPLLIKMMDDGRAAADRQMTMMLELFKNNNKQEPRSESDEFDKLQKLLAIAKELKGGGAAPEKSTTESILEVVSSILPPALNIVGQMMQQQAAVKGMAGAGPIVTPAPRQDNSSLINDQNRQQAVQVQPQIETVMTDKDKAIQMIQAFMPQIISHLAGDGYEFGLWIAQGYGDMIASGVTKFGVDNLVEASKAVPQFWQQIENSYGEPHYRVWLDSLCRYKEVVAELEKEDEAIN